jgi:3'-phosphoadenosine 5'-phosphosulfate (PAPS) 3'-phosphatase
MTEAEQRARALEPTIRAAMRRVVELRKDPTFTIFTKDDESPVTSADYWANDFILGEMALLFPGEHLIGEESQDKSYIPGTQLLWYVDPIDGTKNFISGNNPFHILIGLCLDGEPVLGICAYPTTGDIIVGGSGFAAQRWSDNGVITHMPRAIEWPSIGEHPLTLKGFSEIARKHVFGNNGLRKAEPVFRHPSMMGLAFGISMGYMDHRTIHWWDLCGPAAIMKSLGYEVGKTIDNICAMNDGSLNTSRFHCLLPGTPLPLKELLHQS